MDELKKRRLAFQRRMINMNKLTDQGMRVSENKRMKEEKKREQDISARVRAPAVTVSRILFQIVQFLSSTRQPASAATLQAALGIDMGNENLLRLLQKNPKVLYNTRDKTYEIRRKHVDVVDSDSLLEKLESVGGGVPLDELEEAYVGAKKDVEALEAQGFVKRVKNAGSRRDVVFLWEEGDRIVSVADEAVRALLTEIEFPKTSESAVSILRENNKREVQTLDVFIQESEEGDDGRKRKRSRRPTKLTNTHIDLEAMEKRVAYKE